MARYVSKRVMSFARFQSLKGFQRFCGFRQFIGSLSSWDVSIPKRVSEVLWLCLLKSVNYVKGVSIPKRVSEVLWLVYLFPSPAV